MTNDRNDPALEMDGEALTGGTNKPKPPLGRRFQAGQSGNPSGRPTVARSRAPAVKAVMAEVHEVSVGSRKRKLTTLNLFCTGCANERCSENVTPSELTIGIWQPMPRSKLSSPAGAMPRAAVGVPVACTRSQKSAPSQFEFWSSAAKFFLIRVQVDS